MSDIDVDTFGGRYRHARSNGRGRVVAFISALTFPLVRNMPDSFWNWLEKTCR